MVQKLGNGGHLSGIDAKVDELNNTRGIEALYEIKEWTDLVGTNHKDFPYCYEFDEKHRLRLVRRLI